MATALALVAAAPALAQDAADLKARGYSVLDCVFRERCVIGQPCQPSYRATRYWLNDAEGRAYAERRDGSFRRGILSLDARWKDLSRARSIVFALREAVASQMTMFHDGGAILSVQYAANPGSGQFLLGRCYRDGEAREQSEPESEPQVPLVGDPLTISPVAPDGDGG
ncbi:hypothetical protein [Palleronia sp. THAF1]|uniref:hypothetical protein n=1 Tax=Palleronia sp. THAF1 TaxID=2587842 RepID=UPI000F545E71|nr:hypothetical protein [Palleronia sp. THAF1]